MSIRCLRTRSHQVSAHPFARSSHEAASEADLEPLDATARQNAEQQLAQAAEVNFVSSRDSRLLPYIFVTWT